LNVLFVANDSQSHMSLFGTAEFTVQRNHTNVMCVTSYKAFTLSGNLESNESPHRREAIQMFDLQQKLYLHPAA